MASEAKKTLPYDDSVELDERGHIIQHDTDKIEDMHPGALPIISNQATLNLGMIGHVAHGKTSTVKSLTGINTVKFEQELRRNITIRLGYANAKIYRCSCEAPSCFKTEGSSCRDDLKCPDCKEPMRLVRHVSFVDCPGHDILMSTMLNGAAVMDACVLVIDASQPVPQPQTREHLAAVEVMEIKDLLVLQNKLDLIEKETARKKMEEITEFQRGTLAEKASVVPCVAITGINFDVITEYLATKIPVPPRDFTSSPLMIIIRSFDVNKPGTTVDGLVGGVAGGSGRILLLVVLAYTNISHFCFGVHAMRILDYCFFFFFPVIKGVLRVGDDIEIRPGLSTKDSRGRYRCKRLLSRIVSLNTEKNPLRYAVPGGLIGVGTLMDPTLTRQDRLVGNMLGKPGQLPPVFSEIEIEYYLLKRLVGVKAASAEEDKKTKVKKLQKGEVLQVNVAARQTMAKVAQMFKRDGKAYVNLSLTKPVCAAVEDRMAISRRVDNHWRLIGWARIIDGVPIED
eukprot:TRINITY_DN125752_c0_g1_i2.p1 TRINITY_DN125752_c0_g1~~TRINITY_DN125752_c0_g1_i2.p1  ORF type:complete len:511 (-),score=155.43 TRINITY_DN125752_c0_g1_i2:115-1647(-)